MRAVSLRKFALVAMGGLVFAVAPAASATTFGTCAFDATTNTLTVTEGPESSADHGLPCTPNRTQVPEVAVGNLGFGADLGNILSLCSGGTLTGGGRCTGTVIPVRLIVISDGPSAVVPETGTITLLGTGLIGLAGLVRRRIRG